jgi:hypothetical protein
MGKNALTDGLRHISNFVESRRHTSIMIMNAPHKYDLITPSCVNHEVKVFNRKSRKRRKMFNHIEIVYINLKRQCFTQHVLHMNGAEKELIAQMIANIRRTTEREGSHHRD